MQRTRDVATSHLAVAGRLVTRTRTTLTRLYALTTLAMERRKAGQSSSARTSQAEALCEASRLIRDSHGLRAIVSGALPGPRPLVLVANHLSYVDPIVLSSLVPCIPLAKAELASWPLLGPALDRAGVIFVDRTCPNSGARALRQALYALRSGVNVLNFPEGSTTNGRTILPFRRGIFGAARLTGALVVPIALRAEDPRLPWTGNAAFVPHYARLASQPESVLHVSIGAPLAPGAFSSAEALAQATRLRICTLVAGTHPPLRRPDRPRFESDLAAE